MSPSHIPLPTAALHPLLLRQSNNGRRKIAIALSGGVDSSVVAYLLTKSSHFAQNHDLVGVHMSNWDASDEDDPYCVQEVDYNDARAVAQQLELPLQSTSFAAEYWTQVFEPFSAGVEEGRRPNPDVKCNRYIKFGALQNFVQSTLQADLLATGHYARLWYRSGADHHNEKSSSSSTDTTSIPEPVQQMLDTNPSLDWIRTWGGNSNNGCYLSPLLLAARDRSKCQSFFLSSVPGEAFQNVIFPLGDLLKKHKKDDNNNNINNNSSSSSKNHQNQNQQELTVREVAIMANLPTAHKKDSMGLCFIGKRPFTDFIDQYFADTQAHPYQFVNVDTGEVVKNEFGESTTNHMVYTRGQRAKISGAAQPWFVVNTDKNARCIWVCQGTHHPALYTDTIYIQEIHWMAGDLPMPMQQLASTTVSSVRPISRSSTTNYSLPVLHALCRVRNLQPLVKCQVTYLPDQQVYQVKTEKPLRAITPGQHCALYVGDDGLVCLGGGTILERGQSYWELGKELALEQLHPAGHNDLSVDKKRKGSMHQ
jgi:tRNA-specific 2-thiouridylase